MQIAVGRIAAVLAFALLFRGAGACAQTAAGGDCGLPAPSFVTGAPNIFNDRQEQDLGDALAELTESELRVAPPQTDDELTRIGEKLLATLPPTGIHYRFRVYDSGEINGFSLAGGRVYISRKLVAAVRNEDELAAVLAHELGHISTHQTAIEYTRLWRIRLGVTQVTDRADIFAKLHQFLSTPAKPAEEEDKEEKNQLAADHVALYATVRAGYAPGSFASFLNDSMLNKGKTGNAVTDFFGLTHESSKRYRLALKLMGELPVSCQQKQPGTNKAFLVWQSKLVDERVKTEAEGVTDDRPVKLDPPLKPSLWRIRFSLDGRYVLAQDEGSISVVDRAAAKVLFMIDAPEANGAEFTPDSQGVVFDDDNLRVEEWSIAKGQRSSVKELVVFDGCTQTMLAPDGKTLVCVQMKFRGDFPHIELRLIDVESGKGFYENTEFYDPGRMMDLGGSRMLWYELALGGTVAAMDISQGGRYLVVAVADRAFAYDLERRQPVPLSGKLRNLNQTRLTFLTPDELYVVGDSDGKGMYKAHVMSFPDGRVLNESLIGETQSVSAVTKGGLLRTSPLKDYAVGVLDPEHMQYKSASRSPAIDVWDDVVAGESAVGGLQFGKLGVNDVKQIPLPLGLLPTPRAGMFSPDGRYLAISLKARAEIWDVDTGKRVTLIRPFRTAWIDGSNHLLGEFPKFMDKEAADGEITLAPLGFKDLGKYEDGQWQYGDLQYRFKPFGKDKATDHNATLEVRKLVTQTVLWTRDYPKETPAVWSADDSRLVLAWDLGNDAAKAELKRNPGLQSEAEALKDHKKGLLIETVNRESGAVLEQRVLPEADLSGGREDVRRAWIAGEYVLVQGEHSNTVIYRMDTGAKLGEFFGVVVASDGEAKRVVAVNREDELLIVDEQTGKEVKRFSMGMPIRMAQVVGGREKQLLVLTADQVVHRLPMPR